MTKNNFDIAKEWFARAGDDELSCDVLLKEKVSPSNVCFFISTNSGKIFKGIAFVRWQ
jgi:hypothetical protein